MMGLKSIVGDNEGDDQVDSQAPKPLKDPTNQELYNELYHSFSQTRSACSDHSERCLKYNLNVETKCFESVGVDQELTVYGQKGEYEPLYLSRGFLEFYDAAGDLEKFGVNNIITDGVGEPQNNWNANKFYKVEVEAATVKGANVGS